MRYSGAWHSEVESMKGEKSCTQGRFWRSTGNLSSNYGFMEDERKWWGAAQVSGPHDPK